MKMPDPWVRHNRLYGQNFRRLRASNVKSKTLFVDPYFAPEASSLSYSGEVEGDAARLGEGQVGKKIFIVSATNLPIHNCLDSTLYWSCQGGHEGL